MTREDQDCYLGLNHVRKNWPPMFSASVAITTWKAKKKRKPKDDGVAQQKRKPLV